ncbi:hypothetical protein [Azoarcus sp. DD4]|uniref:hypothetical protein n=1 Tax=Azoarcus sp. DD4 TaxID=2027405 RepID=UPI001F0CE1DF|nr:hypothetical protein [Azoarcus sp. DD4]
MQTTIATTDHVTARPTAVDPGRYARCVDTSRRVRWDIDRDVIRSRDFDFGHKFLPDGLSMADELDFLMPAARRLFSQVQGRSYANIFGLVERFIGAKILEVSREHWLGDQTALEALVRFTDEELKHQAMFRRIESMIAAGLPPGYRFLPQSDEVARAVLAASTWAVLGLTCHIELFTQMHYRESIAADPTLSPLFKDVFLYHWKEESQHAILDELEWMREDEKLDDDARDRAVDDLIALVAAVDGILQMQATADAEYFIAVAPQDFDEDEMERIYTTMLKAYRWQYIVSGVQVPHFQAVLARMTTPAQQARIGAALAPLMYATPEEARYAA